MKKTFCLFAILCSFISLSGQNKEYEALTPESIYTENPSLDSMIIKEYNNETNSLEPKSKIICQYNNNGYQILNLEMHWDVISQKWVNYEKREFDYDLSGNKTLDSQYQISSSNNWIGKKKEEYTFDNYNKVNSRLVYVWRENKWVEWTKTEFNFDADGNELLYIGTQWDYVFDDVWVTKNKTERQFDENGNNISETTSEWKPTNGEWIFIKNVTTEYDNSGKLKMFTIKTWDSILNTWVNANQSENSYDSNENLITTLTYTWNTDSVKWLYSGKQEISYNPAGLKVNEIYSTWNGINDWNFSSKEEYNYDENGNMVQLISYSRGGGEWIYFRKNVYAFDPNYNMILDATYNWSVADNDWKGYRKLEYAFDLNSNETLKAEYVWNNDLQTWKGYGNKIEKEFDLAGNLLSYKSFKWDLTNNSWTFYMHNKSVYDDQLNNTIFEQYMWNTESNTWVPYFKRERTYNTANYLTLEVLFDWDTESQIWQTGSKTEIQYNEIDQPIIQTIYLWDNSNNIWMEFSKLQIEINTNYTNDDLILPYWMANNETSLMLISTTEFKWDETLKYWVTTKENQYFYSNVVLDYTSNKNNPEIKVYPNPVEDYLHISNISEPGVFELYAANGKFIKSEYLTQDEIIFVKDLLSGLYIYKLFQNHNTQTGKIIKK